MVVLVLLGLLAGVVGLSWRRDPAPPPIENQAIATARHRALATGTTIRVDVMVGGRRVTIAAGPDGSIIAPRDVQVDPLTGRTAHE